MNQQQQKHHLRMNISLSYWEAGLECILLVPNLSLDSVVVKAQTLINPDITIILPKMANYLASNISYWLTFATHRFYYC